jgi:hypothetical protein
VYTQERYQEVIDISHPFQDTGRSRQVKKERNAYPAWIKQLVFPDDEDPEAFTNPQCVMAARLDPIVSKRLRLPSTNAYYSLDCTQPLETVLRHTQFVEFPTIEVWEEFEGTIVDIQGVVQQEEQRPTKRMKLNHKAGKKALQGLLGGYGSSEDEQEKEESQNVLATLDQYAGSEDEEMGLDLQEDNGTGTDGDGDDDAEIKVILILGYFSNYYGMCAKGTRHGTMTQSIGEMTMMEMAERWQ